MITLLLGRPYQLAWQDLCEPGWRAYAERHGYDVIPIARPLDITIRAMGRSPAWQKCLILHPSISGKYERVVWLDADIVINPKAPAVANGVPVEKIGSTDEFAYPSLDAYRAFWYRMIEHSKKTNPKVVPVWQSCLDARDYHGFWGLPRRGDHIVQTGVLVLSPHYHRELLEHVYYNYEGKGGRELNYEMRPLSFEIQERKLQHWIDRRFDALFNFLASTRNAENPFSTQEELLEFIRIALDANYFLHFAGDQRLLTAAKMALSPAA